MHELIKFCLFVIYLNLRVVKRSNFYINHFRKALRFIFFCRLFTNILHEKKRLCFATWLRIIRKCSLIQKNMLSYLNLRIDERDTISKSIINQAMMMRKTRNKLFVLSKKNLNWKFRLITLELFLFMIDSICLISRNSLICNYNRYSITK
jgi:hypothetical protein